MATCAVASSQVAAQVSCSLSTRVRPHACDDFGGRHDAFIAAPLRRASAQSTAVLPPA